MRKQQVPDMKGKICVVTGANSGIGLVTARELARAGAQVVMLCRSAERGEVLPIAAVAGACGPVLAHPVEIATRSMTVDRLIAQAGADTAFRSRFLDPGLDPTEPAHRARIAEGLNRVHDRFLRLGAAPWNSAG